MKYKVPVTKGIKNILLFAFFMFLFAALALNIDAVQTTNITIDLTFWLIGIVALAQIIYAASTYCFSMNTFHWLFIFFFFFCSPYLQYLKGSFCLNYYPTDQQILNANLLIILWEITYSFFFTFAKKRKASVDTKKLLLFDNIRPQQTRFFLKISIIICLAIAAFMLASGGTDIIFSRSSGEGVFVGDSSALTSLFSYVVRNFVTYSAAIAIIYFKYNRKAKHLLITLTVLLIITCSPFGMPRFQAATIYCGLLILLFPNMTKKYRFVIGFVFAFLILFPLLNTFRYNNVLELGLQEAVRTSLNNVTQNLTDANFDAYVMLMKVQEYVAENGITWGGQLLGAALFFVPRGIWPGKPYGTGYTIHITEKKYGAAANVSCPLLGEGYVNFGFFGVFLFAAVLGVVAAKLDAWFYNGKNDESGYSYRIIYAFVPTMLFFMMRGDLMSTTSFLLSYIVVGKIVTHFALKNK